MRRGYDRVEGSIGRSYDEINGVTMSWSRDFHMLSEITTSKKVDKFDCLSIAEVYYDVLTTTASTATTTPTSTTTTTTITIIMITIIKKK